GDGGRTWSAPGAGGATAGVRALAIDPWSPGVLYAGTEGNGFLKSTDGGRTWAGINTSADMSLGSAEVSDIAVDVTRPDFVFAAVFPYGVVRSTDGGASWSRCTPEISATGSRATRLLIRGGAAGTLMYGTTAGSIMKSTDSGNSWIPSRTAKDFDGILSLAAVPGRADVVIAGTERGVIISRDFGSSWSPLTGNLPQLPARIAATGAGGTTTLFAFGSGIGLRISPDTGTTWVETEGKPGGSTVTLLATNPKGDRLFAATGPVCLTYNTGRPGIWADAGPGLTGGTVNSVAADPNVPGLVYATTPAGPFFSSDNGGSWQSTPGTMEISPFLIEAHPSIHTRMFLASDQGIFVSTDNGRAWAHTRPLGTGWQVRALTFSPSNAGVIIGATSSSGVIISDDGGLTWEQARYGLPAGGIVLVTLDESAPETFYAYTADGQCYRSLNRGLEWNRYSPPWKPANTFRIAADPRTPWSAVALIGHREVYYSPSGGGTWFRIADADLRGEAVALCWNAATMTLYAGVRDRGVFGLSLGARIRDLLGQ
ncbi:MAG TPA: hypothetical protein VML00_05800, partial [Bacteroidota bacterium]|nr:hypothetical protein [Bacteroidota bacterium]